MCIPDVVVVQSDRCHVVQCALHVYNNGKQCKYVECTLVQETASTSYVCLMRVSEVAQILVV